MTITLTLLILAMLTYTGVMHVKWWREPHLAHPYRHPARLQRQADL